MDDLAVLVEEAEVKGFRERWIDRTERLRRGFAWVDSRAIFKTLLVEMRISYAAGLGLDLYLARVVAEATQAARLLPALVALVTFAAVADFTPRHLDG